MKTRDWTGVAPCVLFLLAGSVHGQYMTTFDGLSIGPLAGQDGYYLPPVTGSIGFDVEPFSAWPGLVYPDGGTNFVMALGPGSNQFARIQRDVALGPGQWRISYDVVAGFLGAPGGNTQNIGSFSGQSSTYIHLFSWSNPGSSFDWRAFYQAYDADGVLIPAPGAAPGPEWSGLTAHNWWYRFATTLDLDTNRITDVSITDLQTGTSTAHRFGEVYLSGGAGGTGGLDMTAFRLFTGGSQLGNFTAWDNLIIERLPSRLWARQFGTPQTDRSLAMFSDGQGGFFVGGQADGPLASGLQGRAWMAHYNEHGEPQWYVERQHPAVRAMTSDGTGGYFAAGGTFNGWVGRFDNSGNELWRQAFGGNWEDIASALAVDGAGGVYVVGTSWGSLAGQVNGDCDATLQRYDAEGNLQWMLQFGGDWQDEAYGAAPDGAGGVYLAGFTSHSVGGPNLGGLDLWLARYNSSGNRIWARQFGTSGSDSMDRESQNVLAPDGAGGVYMTGRIESRGGPNPRPPDAFLTRFDSAGNQLWLRRIASAHYDSGTAVATDGAGGVLVAGYTTGSLATQFAGARTGGIDTRNVWVARYTEDGQRLWVQQFGTGEHDLAFALASDSQGGFFIGGGAVGPLAGPPKGPVDAFPREDAWLARFSPHVPPRIAHIDIHPPLGHNVSSVIPFGLLSGNTATTLHQVYAASLFSDLSNGQPVEIDRVAFAPTSSATFSGHVILRLGYTDATPNQDPPVGLDPPNLAGLGLPNTNGRMHRFYDAHTVYTVPANTQLPSNFQFVFNGHPFYYDPALGNLLLEIQITQQTSGFSISRSSINDFASVAYRQENGNTNTTAAQTRPLRTQFRFIHPDVPSPPECYANCDGSTVDPILNVDDFTCFINAFAAAQALPPEQQVAHYANCDNSTTPPVLNVDDFTCFINAFAAGCP